ncbi:MAG: hypothetical protein ABIG93_01580 [archaeon]|nr:hypothetical protein [Nanoarchaeota archaeon]
MGRKIDFEREFFSVAKGLETKLEVREGFVKKIQEQAEEWIDNKLRFVILGLKDRRTK